MRLPTKLRTMKLARWRSTISAPAFVAGAAAANAVQRTEESTVPTSPIAISDRTNAGLCETIVELGQKRFVSRPSPKASSRTHESHKLQGIGCDIGQGFLFAKADGEGPLHRPPRPAHGRRPESVPPSATARRRCCAALFAGPNSLFPLSLVGRGRGGV